MICVACLKLSLGAAATLAGLGLAALALAPERL